MKLITITLFAVLATVGLSSMTYGQDIIKSDISVENLSKKWKLEEYNYYGYTDTPSKKEENDFIDLKSDMTYSSISEGMFSSGIWKLDLKSKRISLIEGDEEIRFFIDDLSDNQLTLILDDPSEKEAKNLKIVFKV